MKTANSSKPKDRLNEQFAKIGHALSSHKRFEVLDLLMQCEKNVETLARNSGMSIANTSQHLQVLRASGLVEARRDGTHIYYSVAEGPIREIVEDIRRFAEIRLAEVDRILIEMHDETGKLEPVDRARLLELVQSGEVILLDVRPEDEYAASHLPQAVSVPPSRLKSLVGSLPKDKKIVAYCRGAYCVLASNAVKFLRHHGFNASRLADGVADWKQAGLPVVVAEAKNLIKPRGSRNIR